MSFGWGHRTDEYLGVVLDVRASSVLTGLVRSQANGAPNLLWSRRFKSPAGEEPNERRLTALISEAFTELVKTGLQELRKQGITKQPGILQVTVSPPFSYTISRSVTLKLEKPVRVSEKLVRELEVKAHSEAASLAKSELISRDLELHTLSSYPASLTLNGYQTHYPWKSNAKEIALSQVIAMGTASISEHIAKCAARSFPNARLDMDSFMSVLARAIALLAPKADDACLLSVTDKTTELMVVRDDLPQSSSFVALGAASLATDPALYEKALTELFLETKSGLALPRQLFLDSATGAEALKPLVERAAGAATKKSHVAKLLDPAFFGHSVSKESDLLTLVTVFHHRLYEDTYLEEWKNMLK